MNDSIPTSRGTVITQKAELVEAEFPLQDILNPQGVFINELNEMNRYLGSHIDTAYIRDVFIPNTDKIEKEFIENSKSIKQQYVEDVYNEIQQLVPQNVSPVYDPKIISYGGNEVAIPQFTIKISYYKSPYIEIPVSIEHELESLRKSSSDA